MNLKEVFAAYEGDYEDALERMMKEERVARFLRKFAANDTYDKLKTALEAKEYEKAFIEVHNFKGISGNIAATKLAKAASDLTECLRGGVPKSDPVPLMAEVEKQYVKVCDAIAKLEGE